MNDDNVTQSAQETGDDKKKIGALTIEGFVRKNATLFHSHGAAYASVGVGTHLENWPIASAAFGRWLVGLCVKQLRCIPNDDIVKKVVKILEYRALTDHPEESIAMRCARYRDRIYIDLGCKQWRAIEIDSTGWQIVDRSPVKFCRTSNTAQLPAPVRGGSLDPLKALLSCTEEGWVLVHGAMLDALKGRGPYFTLVVNGEPGSAKSTLCKVIRRTIDPLKLAELSGVPKDERDLAADCANEYLLVYDNVSHLKPWLSDKLCQINTGSGFKARALYTNAEQSIIDACAPIVLNGIPDFAEAPDLLSRSLLVRQPVIADNHRLTDDEVQGRYAACAGQALGALLDELSRGLRDEATTVVAMPRMADSTRWVTACLGNDSFLKAYDENRADAVEIAMEASPIAVLLKTFLTLHGPEWTGKPSELLERLTNLASPEHYKHWAWPSCAKSLSDRLRRDGPVLRQVGMTIEQLPRSNGQRRLRIKIV